MRPAQPRLYQRDGVAVSGVTECRPGTYVYNDRSRVALGSANAEDCAMTVLATVVSVPARDRAVVAASIDTNAEDRNKHLK